MCQSCSFFAFFSSFLPFLFSGVSGYFLGLFGGVHFLILRRVRAVFAVALCLRRGSSGVCVLAQYPGGGALWFVPLIRCKNASAGQNQRGRVCVWFVIWAGVCRSLSARGMVQACSSVAHGAAGTFEQVFETSVRVKI